MTTALVTGASVGLGAAFARELARTGHDLVLVSRTRADLEALADRLREAHGVTVEVLPADLSDRADLERVARRLRVDGPGPDSDPDSGSDADRDADPGAEAPTGPVDLLVCNAGYTVGGSFLESDVADRERAHDVMCRAVMVLCHAAGRAMAARGRGAIVNVASVAAWTTAGPYSADKAWVRTFSEGLHAELAPSGVVVTALCPGLTRTEFHDRAGMDVSALPDALWLDADRVVRDCLADVRRGRPVSVPSRRYSTAVGLLDVLPRPAVRLVTALTDRGTH